MQIDINFRIRFSGCDAAAPAFCVTWLSMKSLHGTLLPSSGYEAKSARSERAVQYHSYKIYTLFTFIAVRPLGRPVLPVRKDVMFETVQIFVTQTSRLFSNILNSPIHQRSEDTRNRSNDTRSTSDFAYALCTKAAECL